MTISTSVCRAKNPEFCRYHSSSLGDSFSARAESRYNSLKERLESTKDLEERYELEHWFHEASVDYASTDAGAAFFTKQYEESNDWAEKEQLKELLAEGARLRENVENKANGEIVFPASKLDEAVKRIEKANRKLERAGLEERFTYTTEDFIEEDEEGHSFLMTRLTLSHPTFVAGNYQFVAAVDKAGEDAMVTRVLPGQELDGYRPEHFRCEHCGSSRKRSTTYLLRDRDTGEYKQVGSNCLESFTGVKPRGLWALDYDPEENDNFIDRGKRSWGGADSVIPTKEIVAAALALSDEGENYVSSKVARDYGKDSTLSKVRQYFFSKTSEKDFAGVNHHKYVEQAESIIKNTRFDENNDYNENMRTLLAQEYVSYKHMGYVTSVIGAWKRQTQAQQKAAQPKAVGYLGQPSDPVRDLKVKVIKAIELPNNYSYNGGTRTMLIMHDEQGREIKWVASKSLPYDKDDEFTIKSARIKELGEWNGNEQTVIKSARISQD